MKHANPSARQGRGAVSLVVLLLAAGLATPAADATPSKPARAAPVPITGPRVDDDPGVNDAVRRLIDEAHRAKAPKYEPPPKIFRRAKARFFYRWFEFRCATGSCPFHAIGVKVYPSAFFDVKGWWKLLRVGIGLAASFERSQTRSEYWQHNIGAEALLSIGLQYPWTVTPYLEMTFGMGALHRNIYNKDIFDFAWSFGLEIGVEGFVYRGFHLFLGLGYRRSMVDVGDNRMFIDSFSAAVGVGL